MPFIEDYTEEDWLKLAERELTQTKAKNLLMYPLYRETYIKAAMAWQERNREAYRKYNNALLKRLKEEGRLAPPNPIVAARVHIKKEIKAKNHKKERHRITKKTVEQILMDEEKRIADNLVDELVNGKRIKTLFCIVGSSGSGKTLASLHLKNKCGANVICSFTTRPPRPTEVEGRDHHFIDILPPRDKMLAYTKFGYYKYYALHSQVQGPVTVYVIDEKGLINLRNQWKDEYNIFSVFIHRDKMLRRASGVDDKRIKRDENRVKIPMSEYRAIVENNSTKAAFFKKIEELYQQALKEARDYGWG